MITKSNFTKLDYYELSILQNALQHLIFQKNELLCIKNLSNSHKLALLEEIKEEKALLKKITIEKDIIKMRLEDIICK